MATLEQIGEALKRADAAGNIEDAKKLAAVYKQQQAQEVQQPAVTSPGPRPLPNVDMRQSASPGAFGNNPMAADMPSGDALPPASFDDTIRSFGANIDQIPVAGPTIYNAMKLAREKVQGMTPEQVDAETQRARTMAPGADTAGKLFYNVAPYAVAGAYGPTARMLGIAGGDVAGAGLGAKALDLATRSGAAFGSNMAIGTGDSMARGASLQDAASQNLLPSTVAGSLPLAGASVRALGRGGKAAANWMTGGAVKTLSDMRNPAAAASKVVGNAVGADIVNGSALSPALEAFAGKGGQPLINLDRGGSVTRNLARTAANVNSDAKALLEGATDRGPVGTRVGDFLKTLVGGSADDLAMRSGIEKAAQFTNAPAYRKAYSAPAAQSVWNPQIQQLMYSPEFRSAVRDAEGTGQTWAALHGGQPLRSPFVFAADGSVSARKGVTPTLQFWDHVQRNLRKQAEALGPKEKSAAADLGNLRSQLLSQLDSAVPEFQTARQGAAKFFGAEDALDAGRQFARVRGQVPEAKAAYAKFSPAEQKAFAVGYASEQIDKLGSKDSYAIVKQTFENPNAREMAQLALGPQKAAHLEAFLKVESMMNFGSDALKGGSSTARQLAMMGAAGVGVGAGGYGVATGDWRPLTLATLVTAGRSGAQYLGRSVDQKVMMEVAKLLASGDKAALNRVVANASMSPRWKAGLDAVFRGMHGAVRGATDSAMQPAQITVRGGASSQPAPLLGP